MPTLLEQSEIVFFEDSTLCSFSEPLQEYVCILFLMVPMLLLGEQTILFFLTSFFYSLLLPRRASIIINCIILWNWKQEGAPPRSCGIFILFLSRSLHFRREEERVIKKKVETKGFLNMNMDLEGQKIVRVGKRSTSTSKLWKHIYWWMNWFNISLI